MRSGAFGSILGQFPEAKHTVLYFNMQPLQGGGFAPRTDLRSVSGPMQCTGGRRVRTSHGNLIIERQVKFWSDEPLQVGWFIDDGQYVYRLGIPDDEWTDEIGMTIYTCERVSGADGTELVDPAFKQGTGQFA